MTLNELLEDITSYVNQYKDYEYKTFKSNEDRHQDDEYMEQLNVLLHEELSTYLGVVTEAIENLQKLSVKENYYFFDCAFKVYENHYEKRKEEYLEDHIDVNEADFIKQELNSRMEPRMNRKLKWGRGTYFYDQFIHSDNKLYNSEFKKREFLVYKLELLGWDAYLMDDEDGVPSYYRFEKNKNYQPTFQSKAKIVDMDSSNLSDLIAKTILEFEKFDKEEWELLMQKKETLNGTLTEKESKALYEKQEAHEKKSVEDRKKISELIKQLYYKSAEDNFYWFDCPLRVYKENLDENFKKYKSEFLDDNIEDFLKDEVNKLSNYHKNQFLNYNKQKVDYSSFITYSDKVFERTRGKKLEFLNEKLNEKNIRIDTFDSYRMKGKTILVPKYGLSEPKSENNLTTPKINLESIEQKTEKQLTSNQIVLILQEIGFFAHPKIENTSKVKQAELISKITGLNAKNIKTKIQNLEKSPRELGTQHQKDIDKIDAILDNLE